MHNAANHGQARPIGPTTVGQACIEHGTGTGHLGICETRTPFTNIKCPRFVLTLGIMLL